MRRLSHRLYLTVLASLLLLVLLVGALSRLNAGGSLGAEALRMVGELAAAVLPATGSGVESEQQAIDRMFARLRTDLALFDRDRNLIAAAGGALPSLPEDRDDAGWMRTPSGVAWAIRLPDDRWLVVRMPARPPPLRLGLVTLLAGAAIAIALCTYPIVRGLTARLERLQAGVASLGAGDLSARVAVEGKDEVAELAASFNHSATRIQELVEAHKLLLANVSHELRTPMSRLRVSAELLKGVADPQHKAELESDIAEIDGLIDQVLLSSHLEAAKGLDVCQETDLLALAGEEGSRYADCVVTGQSAVVFGDSTLLRRMLRNLIENARRHGVPPVEVDVMSVKETAVVTVSDHGPGIPAAEHEKAFLPFYRVSGSSRDGGAGLGLALVREIARRHGGEAACWEVAVRPSTVRVTLPIRWVRARLS